MQETAQQYTQRLLGYLAGRPGIRVQQLTPKKLALLTKRLDRKQLAKRPAPTKWSAAEILAHLADSELVIGWRLRLILSSNGAPVQPYDQDVWATTFNYRRRDPKLSLEVFTTLRKSNVALLKRVPSKLLENYGMHAERGKETISHLTNLVAGHDLNHLRQVEMIVKARPKNPRKSKKRQ
jgi:DinB superfamily